jgi:hypothetical protein
MPLSALISVTLVKALGIHHHKSDRADDMVGSQGQCRNYQLKKKQMAATHYQYTAAQELEILYRLKVSGRS